MKSLQKIPLPVWRQIFFFFLAAVSEAGFLKCFFLFVIYVRFSDGLSAMVFLFTFLGCLNEAQKDDAE